MKHYLSTCLMAMILLVTLTSCSTDDAISVPPYTGQPASPVNPNEPRNDNNNNNSDDNNKLMSINL